VSRTLPLGGNETRYGSPPAFEGLEPIAASMKIKASEHASPRILRHGGQLYVLLACTVEDVQHPTTKEGDVVRRQVLRVDDGWQVESKDVYALLDAIEPDKLPGTERAVTDR